MLVTRIPFPMGLILQGLVTLAVYALLVPWEFELRSVGLEPIGLAVLSGFLCQIIRTTPSLFSGANGGIQINHLARDAFGIWMALAAFLIFAPSAEVIQHGISFVFVFWAALFTSVIIWDPDRLSEMNWVGRNWVNGQVNAAGWTVFSVLGFVVINELMITHWSLTDWIIGYAFARISIYYVMWAGIMTTHPQDEEF